MSKRVIIATVVLKDASNINEFMAAYEKLHTFSNISEPETLLYELHQSREDEKTFCVIERYSSDMGVDSHSGSPYRRRFELDLQKLPCIDKFEVHVYNAVDHPLLDYTKSPERLNKGVCVFAGALVGKNAQQHVIATKSLADAIVKKNRTLVYGGGTVGLMGVLAKEVLLKKGKVISVIPSALKPIEISGDLIGNLFFTRTMGERKNVMFSLSDTIIVLPGGLGTFSEVLEVLTLFGVNAYRPKIGFLNANNYFAPFFGFLKHQINEGYLSERIFDFFIVENSTYGEKLLANLESFIPPPSIFNVQWPSDKEF